MERRGVLRVTYKLFICYRRVDKEFARGIEQRLTQEFGKNSVFMDVDDVGGGRDWKRKVKITLEDEPVVVTLVTTRWNSQKSKKWRLLYEEDHIRYELEQALKRGLPIVPVVYEPARMPAEDHLPDSLHPLMRLQRVPFSNDRYEFDMSEVIRALRDLLGEPEAPKTEAPKTEDQPTPATPKTEDQPTPATPSPPRLIQPPTGWTPPTTYRRSMFVESEEDRAAREKALAEEEARREEVRATADPFYARWEFWVAGILTVVLGALAVAAAEWLTLLPERFIDDTLPEPSLFAAVLLILVWAIARIASGAAAYWYDPDRGAGEFYLRGLLGGYYLFFEEAEPAGAWGAFPVATVVPWILARWVAFAPFYFWDWSYNLIFWIFLALYTTILVSIYVWTMIEWGIED